MVTVVSGKLKEKDEFKKITVARTIIFFLDVFLAMLIMTAASVLIKTNLGKLSLFFGFFMLILTSVLRLLRKW